MCIAYLILAHAQPQILERLVVALHAGEEDGIFIHVDKKAPLKPFLPLGDRHSVCLIHDRYRIYWGGFNLVKATLALMEAAMCHGVYDYFVLLSESHYPVRPIPEFKKFLQEDRREYISLFPISSNSSRKWEQRVYRRVKQYHGQYDRKKGMFRGLCRFIENGLYVAGVRQKFDFDLYKGSQWWILSRTAMLFVRESIRIHPEFIRIFRYALIPDELFFHTIIGNSAFRQRAAPDLTFVSWPSGAFSPQLITAAHLRELSRTVERPYFFARKFTRENVELLDYLDRERLK